MKKTQVLDINSELFKPSIESLNFHIKRILRLIDSNDFEEGTVALKINIAAHKKALEIGEDSYNYKEPRIDYSVNSSLKKNYKDSESYSFNDFELVKSNDEFIIKKIDDGQLDMMSELNR